MAPPVAAGTLTFARTFVFTGALTLGLRMALRLMLVDLRMRERLAAPGRRIDERARMVRRAAGRLISARLAVLDADLEAVWMISPSSPGLVS
ncbi:MAG: hypothetical protein C0605_06880 [Hyphomicrobiales bacterium]|nr:MAG: hypothetical protein C0605_06880 [Hyphomicrobiales bacterium]